MRIAFIATAAFIGGAERVLIDLVAGVRRVRPEWRSLVVCPGRGPLVDRSAALGAECLVVEMPHPLAQLGESGLDGRAGSASLIASGLQLGLGAAATPLYMRRLRAALEAFAPDIVHSNGVKAHVLAPWIAGGVPVLWHLHEYVGSRPVSKTVLHTSAARIRAVVAVSRSVADDARDALGVEPYVIENAVDLEEFAPDGSALDLDRLVGLSPDREAVRVGLVGTFARWKGHEILLRALAVLPPELRVRAYVIGDAIYTTAGSQWTPSALQALTATLGLSGRVGFTGFLPAPSALRALDIVVHPATAPEPFGMALAEAMACGRAVITTAQGGAREIVDSDQTALVVPPADVAALASAIATLARSSALRQRLGESARCAAEARFDPSRFTGQMIAVYERALASSNSAMGRTVA